jgi:phosphoenolpyruvate carboxykinase (GTP)
VGELRRDPFAMLPFCGYHMADYWAHWLSMGAGLRKVGAVPRIFQVNWFRKDDEGDFLWPGFGENSRVLAWIVERIEGVAGSVETPLGRMPSPGSIDHASAGVNDEAWARLFEIDHEEQLAEADDTERFFDELGPRVPDALRKQLAELRERLGD